MLVLGATFKENCPDIRNSKVFDVVRELQKYGAKVDVYDPWADGAECKHEYGIRPVRDARSASATTPPWWPWRTASSASSARGGVRKLVQEEPRALRHQARVPKDPTKCDGRL